MTHNLEKNQLIQGKMLKKEKVTGFDVFFLHIQWIPYLKDFPAPNIPAPS